MTRVQVLLGEGQNENLNHLARTLGTTKSKLVRDAVDAFLKEKISKSHDPLFDLIGQAGESEQTDISSNHDEYLTRREMEQWAGKKSL